MKRKTSSETCCNNNNFNAYLHDCTSSDMTFEFTNLLVNDYSVQVYFLLLAWYLMLGDWCLLPVFDTCCLLVAGY